MYQETAPQDSLNCDSNKPYIHSPNCTLNTNALVGPIISPTSNKGQCVTNTSITSTKFGMDSSGTTTTMLPLSRLQEKEELQRLNDRFSTYFARVRHLGQQGSIVDTSAFLHSTKILEDEITSLKNMYQMELDKLRNEIEAGAYEKNSLHSQCNKQHKYIGELQDRLTIEKDKNTNLLDEINTLHRKISNLEGTVQDAQIAAKRPQDEIDHLQRNVENLTREVEQWKHRCEQEYVANQQGGERLKQIMMKADFSEQVQKQQIQDYQNRLDMAAANILSLEARVRELSVTDVSTGDILKQVRDTAEVEIMKYQMESEDIYNRNLSALKAKIDSDGSTIQRLAEEKSELSGCIGELQAKIRNLEGQVANLQYQKRVLEDTVNIERKQASDNIIQLEKKLRDVQDMLVTKMFELTSARESSVPLKVEIEALNTLLEEEERRLQEQLVTTFTSVPNSNNPHFPTASEIFKTNSLSALQAATSSQMQTSRVNSCFQIQPSRTDRASEVASPLHHQNYYSTSYISESQQPGEQNKPVTDTLYKSGLADDGFHKEEAVQRSQYIYESSPSLSRLHIDPSHPSTPRALGPVSSRAQSAPSQSRAQSAPSHPRIDSASVKTESDFHPKKRLSDSKSIEKRWNYIPSNFGCGRDYFEEMFYDLQNKSLLSNSRPKSSSFERTMPSSFHDYTVLTFHATGDLKIKEIDKDGKYVQLVNEGTIELDISEYIIRQNVDGQAVAIFRFPPHINILPNCTVTVWAAINDPELHNPPTDFYWSEQEKWGTGPEYSTILCRSNGQAVAWTTATNRHARSPSARMVKSANKLNEVDPEVHEDASKNKKLSDQNTDCQGPGFDSTCLKRGKKQRPVLASTKISNGGSSDAEINNTKQIHSTNLMNDRNSYNVYQSTKTQRIGGMPVVFLETSQQPRPPIIRGNGTIIKKQAGSIEKASNSSIAQSIQKELVNGVNKQSLLAS